MESGQKKPMLRLKRNLVVIFTAMLVVVISIAGYLSNIYGHFQIDYNKLSEAMRNGDIDAVERQMDAMVQYNDLSRKWHLGPIAEKYLFSGMYINKAVETLLKRDFRALMDDKTLAQNTNNHLIAHILGVARAQYYQGLYQEKLNNIKAKNREPSKRDLADLDVIVEKVIKEARPYFRLAVENSPGNNLHFEYPFNFDLLQNEESARKALENPGEQPQPLGYGDGPPDGKKPTNGKDGENPTKLNPGDQPGGPNQPRKPKG